MERLQKIIARGGVASRRKAEELIKEGRVSVNGTIVTEMGLKVSFDDIILVDGIQVQMNDYKYFVLNKPRYVISSANDEHGRDTVISILPDAYQSYRLFPVGRLDYDTKGVLLITNDGEFMNKLVGPQSRVEKEYLARIDGIMPKEVIEKMANGVVIDGYKTRKCRAYLDSVDQVNKSCLVGIVLKEGKYHQVKRMFQAMGYPVKRLTRIRFGEITTEGLKEGQFRELKPHEIKRLLVSSEKGYFEK